MNMHFNKIINVPESSSFFTAYDKMISHLQTYSGAPDSTSIRVHLLNSLQSQFSLNDGTPYDQRYRHSDKCAQSNLGRGLRRGTVTHVCSKVPIFYNGWPQTRPQKYPFSWTDPQTHYLSRSWTRPTYDAKRHPDPICRCSTMHWTDQLTYAPTD